MTSKELESCKFGEEFAWPAPTNNLQINSFSAIHPISWQSCREIFSKTMKNKDFKGFFFVHGAKENNERIANFIFKTEQILDLKEKTTYNKTSCDSRIKINMTDFWLSSYVKRSFFTLLPRLGKQYDIEKDNYEDTLFTPVNMPAAGYEATINAVKRFLYGFTEYDGQEPMYSSTDTIESRGWCSLFANQESWKKLVDHRKNKVSPLAVNKLWG